MKTLAILTLLAITPAVHAEMVDPAIDLNGPFSYISKPTTTLGAMAGPEGTQVTFDGAFYTGAAELCFFWGEPLRPVMVRQKTLMEGWLPVVQYGWREGPLAYSVEAFGATLDGDPTSNLINFVQVRITNCGTAEARASFAAAMRLSGRDHRCEGMAPWTFGPDISYEMKDGGAYRGGALIYTYPPDARLEAVPGVAYARAFTGRDHSITERAEACLARTVVDVAAGRTEVLTYKLPQIPVTEEDAAQIAAIQGAEYDEYLARTINFWQAELAKGTQISVPEQKVNDTWRAGLMYDLMAIDTEGDAWVQKVNELQYDWFWLRDGAYIIRGYDLYGHHETAEKCLEHFLRTQREDGLFSSQGGQLDGFGQALWSLGQHYLMTGDREWARRVYKQIPPAIAWLKRARAADGYHIMPPTHAHDNENIDGRYTGHNFWALAGVRSAIILARATEHEADARAFQAEYDNYNAAFMKRLEEVCGTDGYIPPGLDVQGGQDWGNNLGLYPGEVLEPFDGRVTASLEKQHREKYAEGIMTYAGVLHWYVTVKVTQNHVIRGEQEQALRDFYGGLLHTGSTQEGFEMDGPPWGMRDSWGNYPPHGWGASMYNALLRNMLVREWGGKGGLEPRELHLFSVTSPAWAVPGKSVTIKDAATECGPLSAAMSFSEAGATVTLDKRFRRQPQCIVVHIPYFVELKSFEADARTAELRGDGIWCSPDVTRLELKWERKEAAPLSFASTVGDYKDEYARRFAEYVAGGGKPVTVEAPRMLTAQERERQFAAKWGPEVVGIAVGKPVTSNGGTEQGKGPERAVDGDASNRDDSAWWAGPPTPRWLCVDLEKPTRIGSVRVYPYWDGGRYYQYTVEVSVDGKGWATVGDMSASTKAVTEAGDLFEFEPREARYVRVTMTRNSANPSVHLVEVRVFAGK